MRKKPLWKKWWFYVIALFVIISFSSTLGDKGPEDETNPNNGIEESAGKDTEAKKEKEKEDNIPKEYKSALKSAESYSKTMNMSKQGIYNQLTSEHGEKFGEEAGQYAIDNIEADWNKNALKSAESYSKTMNMSKQSVYNQLISEHGEEFTEEEAQYAIDNIKADWKENALKTGKSYQEDMSMSPAAIKDQLTSEYGEQFTEEEAQYAMDHLDD